MLGFISDRLDTQTDQSCQQLIHGHIAFHDFPEMLRLGMEKLGEAGISQSPIKIRQAFECYIIAEVHESYSVQKCASDRMP